MGAVRVRDDLLAAIEAEVARGASESVEAYVEEALRAELHRYDAARDDAETDPPAPPSESELAAILDASLADVAAGKIVPVDQVLAELRTRAGAVKRVREAVAAKA
jgi:predicted transcriptional regulator